MPWRRACAGTLVVEMLCVVLAAMLWGLLAGPAVAGPAADYRLALIALDGTGETVRLVARLTDASGATVPDAEVRWKVRTAFGWLQVGTGRTDPEGLARVTIPVAAHRRVEVTAEAAPEGTPALATLAVGSGVMRAPAHRPGADVLTTLSPQPGLISPYPPVRQVAILGPLIGGIWMTYAAIALLLWKIRRLGRG